MVSGTLLVLVNFRMAYAFYHRSLLEAFQAPHSFGQNRIAKEGVCLWSRPCSALSVWTAGTHSNRPAVPQEFARARSISSALLFGHTHFLCGACPSASFQIPLAQTLRSGLTFINVLPCCEGRAPLRLGKSCAPVATCGVGHLARKYTRFLSLCCLIAHACLFKASGRRRKAQHLFGG